MHAVTGDAGSISVAAGVLNGKFQGWETDFDANLISDRGGGEVWESRNRTHADYTVRGKVLAPNDANWAFLETEFLAGVPVVFSLKRKTGDAQPYMTGTAQIEHVGRRHNLGANSEAEVVIKCSEGVAPTMDPTPEV